MRISQEDFEDIIRKVAAETPNCERVEISGTKVTMYWYSQRGNHYAEKYDFDDNGEITGFIHCLSPEPYHGSTVPGIFENKAHRAICRFIES